MSLFNKLQVCLSAALYRSRKWNSAEKRPQPEVSGREEGGREYVFGLNRQSKSNKVL